MFSRFFIDRPIFATVLSVVITMAGGIAVFALPLAQFPSIAPPTVQVTCNYPGASARDVAEAVAAPIEQQVNGVENMLYMSSQCANDGSYSLTVTFRQGVDLDMAQVLVQNRVSLAVPALPEVIKQTGVSTLKRSPDILMGMALVSPDRRYDQLYLSNYAVMQVKDELARLDGVGEVLVFGQRDYSMRIWVDPNRLGTRNLAATDVVRAIREQNVPVATGWLGQRPGDEGEQFQVPLAAQGRLRTVEEFQDIILRALPDGRVTRLKDVARVELGSKSHALDVCLDGQETVFLAIFQRPDANALETRERVLAKIDDLKLSFPPGLDYVVGFDTTPYTRESIREVFKTLRDAIILVAIVVLVFLQNWRSAIIPLVAVPVAIIGTFAVMLVFCFSLNNLTLFGLVLAIGIVVDDAIVVVEAVEHHIEDGLSPREATIKAMDQVAGPVIAVGLVLSAVFIPCAFISGITGQFFRQFALTIAASTIISAFNSLTLSPALTALLLRPISPTVKGAAKQGAKETRPEVLPRFAFAVLGGWLAWEFRDALASSLPAFLRASEGPLVLVAIGAVVGWLAGRPLNGLLGAGFRLFNWGFLHVSSGYTRLVGLALRGSVVVLLLYGGLLLLTYHQYQSTPRGFIPSQDMGYLMVNVLLPDSASAERTIRVMQRLQQIALEDPGIRHATYISGQSFVLSAAGSNFGSMFLNLKDYADRRTPELSSDAIANRMRQRFGEVLSANVAVFGPPPVRGVGRAGGFALMVEDRGDVGPQTLQKETEELIRRGMEQPGILGLFSVFRANVPQLHIDPDPRECMAKGVDLQDFADAVQTFEGSLYVNDFNRFGRTWQVIVQAEPEFRDQVEDLSRLPVRTRRGGLAPLGSLAQVREVNGPLVLTRYNMYPAAAINGMAAPGMSSGQVMDTMQRLARETLPQNMAFEWTDISFLEQKAGSTGAIIFFFAVVMVFLVLAAQYESWSLPLAVILVVPMCLLCAIAGVNIARMDINIFTQVGFVVLVGLASKNAILIVEFAKRQYETGTPLTEATLAACRLRLRPIVMTSLAFVLGVVPLVLSHGAGMEMRQALGVAVFSGMLGVTLFGLFLTPVFFHVIERVSNTRPFTAVRGTASQCLDVLRLGPLVRAGAALWSRSAVRSQEPGLRRRASPAIGPSDAPTAPSTIQSSPPRDHVPRAS